MNPLIPARPSGFQRAPSVRARCIWRRCWRGLRKRDCRPRSASMAMTCRTAATPLIPADGRGENSQVRSRGAFSGGGLMRGKSYLGMGGVSLGIAGSIVDQPFFESYLGMRVETIDMTEFLRAHGQRHFITIPNTKRRSRAWTKKNCKEGKDYNSAKTTRSRKQLTSEWEKSVQMALIARDLMVGNPRLAEMGFGEEAQGHNAIASGFQGQRQWTDYQPNGDYLEAILNTSFDWNGIRAPYIVATENDCLNGASMLFGYLLTNTAANLRRCAHVLERGFGQTRFRPHAGRRGQGRHFAFDQFWPGHARRHRPAIPHRPARHETVLGNLRGRGAEMPGSDHVASPSIYGIFSPARRLEHALSLRARQHAGDHVLALNSHPHKGLVAGAANCRGPVTVDLPGHGP